MALLWLFIPLLAQIILLFFLSRFLSGLFLRRLGRGPYLFFMWPGVVVHEAAHLIGCLLTRTKVLEVKFFSPRQGSGGVLTLGYVRHVQPKNPLVSLIIGSAPFFGGSAALWLLLWACFPLMAADLPFGAAAGNWTSFSATVDQYARFLFDLGVAIWGGGWRSALFVYLLLPLAAHVAPSLTDLKHTLSGLAVIASGLSLIILAGRHLSLALPGRLAAVAAGPLGAVTALVGYGLASALLAASLFGLLVLAWDGLKRLWPRRRNV